MWSSGSLKVVNSESSQVFQELIADCRYISFFSLPNDDLLLVGYNGSNLHIFSFTNPEKSQVVSFDDTYIVSAWFSSKGIYAILGTNRIAFITKSKGLWENKSLFTFALNERKIVACFPIPTGIVIFIQQYDCIIVGLSENPPEWHQICRIDCFKAAESVNVCLSLLSEPQSIVILIGTQDGHVYQLEISKKNLMLLCDIQQPVTSIVNLDNQIAIIVGKYGKIAMLNASTKETLISFAPTAVEDCFYSKHHHQLYFMGSDQLFSMEIKASTETGFLGEANYCHVKFARSVYSKGENVFILTENGTIYQSSLLFGSKEDKKHRESINGAQVKPILEEIHRCADHTKALSAISDRVLLDVAQLSIALHMVNQDVSNRFPVTIRSFSDPRIPQNQNLIVSVTNNSEWKLSSLHWTFQICVQRTNQSSVLLSEEWKPEQTVQLEHQFLLSDDTFDAEVKLSLIFRFINQKKQSGPQSLCCFSLSTVKLNVLDFLEPTVSNLFDEKNSISSVLGFSRTQIRGCPWPILLQQSWHRGFAQKFGYTSPLQIVLRCGLHLVRMILKEDENHSEKIWILRIETSNSILLRLLCAQIFQLIEARHPLTKTDVVNIPTYVLDQLQNLKGRLNYLQSLGNWDESDVEPLMEEFRHLMAKQFSVR